jgi:hypothetical protein
MAAIGSCQDSGTDPADQVFNLPDSNVTYIDHIKPMFTAKCASHNGCHSGFDQAGGLNLTNYEAIILHQLDSGEPLVRSGYGETSALFQILLADYSGIPRMPREGPYLNSNNSNGVKIWINEGLNYSGD